MKFKVYEVERIQDDSKDEDRIKFLYANYEDAIAKFNELVAEEKMVDWVAEALTRDEEDFDDYDLTDTEDYWALYVNQMFDSYYSEVSIIEREVL